MKEIKIIDYVGSFAENKEKARELRLEILIPTLEKKEVLILNFEGVGSATQSFIHALISDLFRKFGSEVLDMITFKNCSEKVQKVIGTVSDYMQAAE